MRLGSKHKADTIKKISKALKGRLTSTGMLGNHHSEETKRKMSLAQIGEKHHGYNPDRDFVEKSYRFKALVHSNIQMKLKVKKNKLMRHYIESQFTKEMSWNNKGRVWQIDHIRPIIDFFINGELNIRRVNALENIRPVTVEENHRKYKQYKTDKKGDLK